jgi:rhodanese-related sulfurtransferase
VTLRSAVLCLGVIAALTCAGPASAELHESMAELLEGYSPQGLECTHREPDPQPTKVAHRLRDEGGCWIALDRFERLRDSGEVFVADLRMADEYQRGHINGAVPARVSDIATKEFLKNRVVVLVDSGRRSIDTLSACVRLRQIGLTRAYALRGGMQAWWLSGRPSIGPVPSPAATTSIGVAELMAESASQLSTVILAAGAESLSSHFPGSKALGSSSLEVALKAMLGAPTDQRLREAQALVLVSGKPLSEQEKERLLQISTPRNLFIYDADLEAIRRFVADRQASWRARERAAQQPRCFE